MYAMHDRTRRLLGRLSFLAFCLAPTLAMSAWIGVVRSPAYIAARKAAWERTIAQQTGLAVSMDAVRSPARGITVLEGLTLRDPETDACVARVRRVQMGHNGDEFVVIASQPELESEQMWRLWESLHERVLRGSLATEQQALFYAREVTVRRAGGERASTLTDVHGRLKPTPTGPQATIRFRDVALQMAEAAQLQITRNRTVTPPTTRWELDTGPTSLPCSLLAHYVEILASLGDGATFQGSVAATPTLDGWEGEVRGYFRDVDLDRLVKDRYAHKLSGMAQIRLQPLRFRGGRLIDAAGQVSCEGGVVSRSLLYEADQSLGVMAAPRVLDVRADDIQRYRELKFGFNLGPEGLLRISGLCSSVEQGVVMTDHYGPVLTDKPQEVKQAVALVRMLISPSGEQVPATYEAAQLLHVLPLPTTHSKPALNAMRPIHVPVRAPWR
jgi:hypothetical protein